VLVVVILVLVVILPSIQELLLLQLLLVVLLFWSLLLELLTVGVSLSSQSILEVEVLLVHYLSLLEPQELVILGL
jgi:hypothetical protein